MSTKIKADKSKNNRTETYSDGWILFKRCVFCGIGIFSGGVPVFWVFAQDRQWTGGMTILCIIGGAFFALGMFGSRKLVSKADI